jgi:hypothetical protein
MSPGTSPRPPFLQAYLVPLGFVAAWTLIVGLLLTSAATAALSERSAYDAAPVCSSSADVSGCRYQGTGKVARVYYVQGSPYLDVRPDGLGGDYSAGFVPVDAGAVTAWGVGSTVPVEIWKGRLVRVGGVRSISNPDSFVAAYMLPAGLAVGGVGLLLVAIFAWRLLLYRKVLRRRNSKLGGADPSVQVLPLTPSMKAYLESLIRQNLGWVDVLLFERTPANAARDLERGVFLRESGPFAVDVASFKGFRTAVVVSVGRRSLKAAVAESLEEVSSQTGKVDYLPSTGELMALWDDHGNLLAARLPGSAPELMVQSAAR